MRLHYKTQKVLSPFCDTCGEFMSGNNSEISPYTCSCGQWKASWEKPWDFNLIAVSEAEG